MRLRTSMRTTLVASGELIAKRIAGLPAYLLGALLAAVAPAGIIALVSKSPVPDLAYVFGGVLFLAVLLIGWIIGDLRSAPREAGQTFTNVLWERSRFNIADQQALAEFLSADYDERAEVIYLVTSGYSVNGGPTSDL